ncbi:ABC transporter C family member 8 [Penicillium subrubescens]|uniref:ABC transporter C family member 8 n=2 Tax=Penicillium subrubescens TaxID=1316194 RepID=A0A1Q5TDV5_9EURO|nr:ABC transporter C family member 8 [Penicillium subrubescens]
MPLLLAVIWFVQRYYLRTSRQVRLLEIEAKSPLYTHFTETIAGISTIKAYHWQSQFQQTCDEHINNTQRTYYMLLSIQQWLAFILDLLVAVMAVVIVSITTCLHDKFSPGEIGVALNIVLTFNDALAQAITSWTQVETSIGAVTRVQRFRDTTPTELRQGATETLQSVHDWPSRGAVVFHQVTACYSSNTPPALTNVNLTIKPSEKIAICGPSGSGKTSLILALLQMIEVRSGSISIDGRDLQSLRPGDIRSRINVTPQDPFFIPGTVAYNLDPTATASNVLIETALRKAGLWEKISYAGGLSADLQPTSWSAGEKHLFALARALTNDSQIVILDEVTSSVDTTTEIIMQRVIQEEFPNRTVIAIVHRFGNIDLFDRVAVLQRGEVVEYDTPKTLLSQDSKFRELYVSSLGHSCY